MSPTSKPSGGSRGTKRPSVAFIGLGALASSMARSLAAHGYRITEFVVRTPSTRTKGKHGAGVETLVRELNARISTFENCALDADILWFAVPDDAIEDCAARIAKGRKFRGKIALHSSGALASNSLAPLQREGASTASLHPMMSFSTGNRNPELRGVWFSVEGEGAAVRVARKIVNDVGGNLHSLKAEQKALYHAFGAMIAPLLVSHLEAAERMGQRAGLTSKGARAAMKPIVEKVLAAFLAGGAQQAFSGPFLRGDVKTVDRHLRSIKGSDEDAIYRALARYAIEHIQGENKSKLRKLLARP